MVKTSKISFGGNILFSGAKFESTTFKEFQSLKVHILIAKLRVSSRMFVCIDFCTYMTTFGLPQLVFLIYSREQAVLL